MAKRAPMDEKPFRPLDESLLGAVIRHRPGPSESVTIESGGQELPAISAAARPSQPALGSRLDQEKRVLFTREETQALERMVNQMASRLSAQVKASHVLRALTGLLLAAEAQVDQRAREHGTLVRPPNGDFVALQRFEREIARILAHALRDAGLPR